MCMCRSCPTRKRFRCHNLTSDCSLLPMRTMIGRYLPSYLTIITEHQPMPHSHSPPEQTCVPFIQRFVNVQPLDTINAKAIVQRIKPGAKPPTDGSWW